MKINIREKDESNIHKIGIYCITNLINGKKYIGKTGKTTRNGGFLTRWQHHINKCFKPNYNTIKLYCAIHKYGLENFEFSIIEIVDAINNIDTLNIVLNHLEKYWINYYKTTDSNYGYNMTVGGDGVLGYKTVFTEEHKQKISESNKGKVFKPETIELMRINNTGERNPYFGKKSPLRKKIVQLDNNMNIIKIFDCTLDLEKYNFHRSSVRDCCKNKRKSLYSGFKWKFLNDYIKSYSDKYTEYLNNPKIKFDTDQDYIDYINKIKDEIEQEKQLKKLKKLKHKLRRKPRASWNESIVQLNLDGSLVKEYKKILELNNITIIRTVSDCVNHKYKSRLGDNIYGPKNPDGTPGPKYIWMTKKEYDQIKEKID